MSCFLDEGLTKFSSGLYECAMAHWTWGKPGTIEAKPQKKCVPGPWSGWPDTHLGLTSFRQNYSAEL